MNLGRLRRVQALLVHLTRCLSALDVIHGESRQEKEANSAVTNQRYRTQVRGCHTSSFSCMELKDMRIGRQPLLVLQLD